VALPAHAGLLSVEPVKNARALLRNSLPIKNATIREIQVCLAGCRAEHRGVPSCCSTSAMKQRRPFLHQALAMSPQFERCMLQKSLESVSEQLRIPGSKSLGPIGQVGHRWR
jgi:hypothetical protein